MSQQISTAGIVKISVLVFLGLISFILGIILNVGFLDLAIFLVGLIFVAWLLRGLFHLKDLLLQSLEVTSAEGLKEYPWYPLVHFAIHWSASFLLALLISILADIDTSKAILFGVLLHFAILVLWVRMEEEAEAMYGVVIGAVVLSFFTLTTAPASAKEFLTLPIALYLTFLAVIVTFVWIIVHPMLLKNKVQVKKRTNKKAKQNASKTTLPDYLEDSKSLLLSLIAGLVISTILLFIELLRYHISNDWLVLNVAVLVVFALLLLTLLKYGELPNKK